MTTLREDANEIVRRAVRSVLPDAAVRRALAGRAFPGGRVYVVAAGKGGELLFYPPSDGIPQELKKASPRRAMDLVGALGDAELDIMANLSQNVVLTALLLKA